MTDFFVTLLSNSSMKLFPENKTSSFTVQLPEKISLHGSWSVGVVEVHYNYNFFNVTKGNNAVVIEKTNDKLHHENDIFKSGNQKISFLITPGYYGNVNDITMTVNKLLQAQNYVTADTNVFDINPVNNRTVVNKGHLHKSIISLSFEGRLAMQMGFKPQENILNFNLSPHVGNTNFGIPDQMMIYTDVIEPTYIGHEKAYVLKIINTEPSKFKFGDACYKEFTNIHYMRVQKREFEAISVDIRECKGSFMPFEHGILIVKLHFKKNGV